LGDLLLNDNQRRHLAAFLHLLLRDLANLRAGPGLAKPICDSIDAVAASARAIVQALELTLPPEREIGHRVRVVAEVWGMRAHDIRAGQLKSYGAVHPDLGERLDPLVTVLQARLRDLAAAATQQA